MRIYKSIWKCHVYWWSKSWAKPPELRADKLRRWRVPPQLKSSSGWCFSITLQTLKTCYVLHVGLQNISIVLLSAFPPQPSDEDTEPVMGGSPFHSVLTLWAPETSSLSSHPRDRKMPQTSECILNSDSLPGLDPGQALPKIFWKRYERSMIITIEKFHHFFRKGWWWNSCVWNTIQVEILAIMAEKVGLTKWETSLGSSKDVISLLGWWSDCSTKRIA